MRQLGTCLHLWQVADEKHGDDDRHQPERLLLVRPRHDGRTVDGRADAGQQGEREKHHEDGAEQQAVVLH